MHARQERWNMIDLADAAGVGVGSVYDYFADLMDIETAVAERRCVATLDAITDAVTETTTSPAALATLRSGIRTSVDRWCQTSAVLRTATARALMDPASLAARRRLNDVMIERSNCTPPEAERLGQQLVERIRIELTKPCP